MLKFIISVITASLLMLATGLQAQEMMMVRSKQPFEDAMLALQTAIQKQGYQLSRIQRVDVGLTHSGYQTDKYRVVFFGKPEEVRKLVDAHPELIPYLPLKIAVFAEDKETLLVTANPAEFEKMYPDAELRPVFERWASDIQTMLDQVRQTEGWM